MGGDTKQKKKKVRKARKGRDKTVRIAYKLVYV